MRQAILFLFIFLLFIGCGGGSKTVTPETPKIDVQGKYSFETSDTTDLSPTSLNMNVTIDDDVITVVNDERSINGLVITDGAPITGTVNPNNTFTGGRSLTGVLNGAQVEVTYTIKGTFTETGWSGEYSISIDTEKYDFTFTGSKLSDVADAFSGILPESINLEEPIIEGLVVSFKFNGNALSEDGTRQGTTNGVSLVKDRFGNANSAFAFDGVDDYIEIPQEGLQTTYLTVSFWAKPEYNSYEVFIDNGYVIRIEDPSLYGFIGSFAAPNYLSTEKELDVGEWQMITVVKDLSNTQKIYINGTLEISESFQGLASSIEYTNDKVQLGRLYVNGKGYHYFKGAIDDINFYNRALTDDEIKSLYIPGTYKETETPEVTDITKGLVADYKFNGDFNDSSIYQNNATNHGSVLVSDRNGVANSAVEFDGMSSVSASYQDQLNFSNMSVAFWVKVKDLITSDIITTFSGNGWYVRLDGSLSGNVIGFDSTNIIEKDVWTHIVITNGGYQPQLYINGVLQSEELYGTGSDLNAYSHPLYIGGHSSGQLGLIGILDEVRLYNRVVTAEEVKLIMEVK